MYFGDIPTGYDGLSLPLGAQAHQAHEKSMPMLVLFTKALVVEVRSDHTLFQPKHITSVHISFFPRNTLANTMSESAMILVQYYQ